jgi:hypothetical protein
VFLGQDVRDNTHVWASAWVINVQSPEELAKQYHPAYLVTATHALERLERKGISTVRIRVNLKTGQSQWLPSISIARWKAHPDSTVDVSFLKHEIRQEWDHEGWPTTAFVTANSIKEDHEEIELGDEVFPKFSSVVFAASPLTATKEQIEIGNGGTEEFLVPNPWNICSRVNKCSTEMVHTDAQNCAMSLYGQTLRAHS